MQGKGVVVRLELVVLALLLVISLSVARVQATDAHEVIVYPQIKTRIGFIHWSEKGGGKPVGSDLITVVTAADIDNGDVVVLRWSAPDESDDRPVFTTEVYRAEPSSSVKGTWALVSDTQEKTLIHQLGQRFIILETVPGVDGGQRRERFELKR